MSAQCSKGWGSRCAASRGKRCRCACGGKNHGGLGNQLSITDEGALSMTPREVLEYEWDEPIVRKEIDPADDRVIRFERILGNARILVSDIWGAHELKHVLVRHSPTGMEFGYGGSGPSDTALNILRIAGLTPKECNRLHQDFKWVFVAKATTETVLQMRKVKEWIRDEYAKEAAAGMEYPFEAAVPESLAAGAQSE